MFKIGEVIEGKYELVRKLGEGGMGQVWVATHKEINKKVAIKFLDPQLTKKTEAAMRFKVEAKAAASINNRHIINIYDFGVTSNGLLFIVMECLQGEELAELIKRDKIINLNDTMDIMLQVVTGLEAAHKKGIIHRDLKPENIFLVDDESGEREVKLLDFGIAKIVDPQLNDGKRLTQTGMVIGTPCYLSPEQTDGTSVLDHRVDIYAVGVILYECLTGTLPFNGEKLTEIIINIFKGKYTPLKEIRPDLPDEINEIVKKCMAYKTEDRYENAVQLKKILKNFKDKIDKAEFFSAKTVERINNIEKDTNEHKPNSLLLESNAIDKSSYILNTKSTKLSKIKLGIIITSIIIIFIGVGFFIKTNNNTNNNQIHAKQRVIANNENKNIRNKIIKNNDAVNEQVLQYLEKTVEINFERLPSGAKIFLDNSLQNEIPIKTKMDSAEHLLRIEAVGYNSKELKIILNEPILNIDANLDKIENIRITRDEHRTKINKANKRNETQSTESGLKLIKLKIGQEKDIKLKRINIIQ